MYEKFKPTLGVFVQQFLKRVENRLRRFFVLLADIVAQCVKCSKQDFVR